MKHFILCVDDEIDNVEALERIFRKDYSILKATSGKDALDLLRDQKDVAVIISDQRMPNMTGVEFLKRSMKTHPDAVRILLTGYTDIDSVIGAINAGQVYRYITKPWDPLDLKNTIDKAVEKYDLSAELKEKNEALAEALDELKSLDKAKNEFMILINHELKTPLTVIISFLELMLETTLDKEQQKYLNRISQSADRLHDLINDALELVSAETGQIKASPKKMAAKKLETLVDPKFSQNAKEREQKLIFDIGVGAVKADQKILKSVLDRLIDNAVKYGDKNSDIFIESKKSDNGFLQISVTNKGKSLTKESIRKILKPFAVDENILNHSRGTGLGLPVVQALLKSHDSALEIKCPKGKFQASFQLPKA